MILNKFNFLLLSFVNIYIMGKLNDNVALVTASADGIGLAIAQAMAQEGALVYIADINMELATSNAEKICESGNSAKAIEFNALSHESIINCVQQVIDENGRLDILVNNFGGTNPKIDRSIFDTKVEEFDRYVLAHINSVYLTSQTAINKVMIHQKSGSIINIASVSGINPDLTQIAYGTSKAAIIHMTKQIAIQSAKYNICCNAVAPGMIDTKAVKNNLSKEFEEIFLRNTPISRMGKPYEIADAVLYFACSKYTTGQIIAVNGGFGMGTPLYSYLVK